jgi:hypothetical protein
MPGDRPRVLVIAPDALAATIRDAVDLPGAVLGLVVGYATQRYGK